MISKKEEKIFIVQTIRKWGNSQGIRLPKKIIEGVGLSENDEIGISIEDGKMVIEKINNPRHFNLKERLETFYNKPIDEIYVENTQQEVCMGVPVGKEIW